MSSHKLSLLTWKTVFYQWTVWWKFPHLIFYRKIRLYKTNFLYRYNKEAVFKCMNYFFFNNVCLSPQNTDFYKSITDLSYNLWELTQIWIFTTHPGMSKTQKFHTQNTKVRSVNKTKIFSQQTKYQFITNLITVYESWISNFHKKTTKTLCYY